RCAASPCDLAGGGMTLGADDYIANTGATAATLAALPREDILPPLIHLIDLEQTQYVGRTVRTDIVIAGGGATYHDPRGWTVACPETDCRPVPVDLGARPTLALLQMCRMSKDQVTGFTRHRAGCPHRSDVTIRAWATVTELLALPAANLDAEARDYREKVVALVGTLPHSN